MPMPLKIVKNEKNIVEQNLMEKEDNITKMN